MNHENLAQMLGSFTRLSTLEANWRGKDYFVGDIAGQYSVLKHALHKAQFDPRQDRLFCTGNLIDPGIESREVLNLVMQPWFFSVLGVHELMLLDALQRGHYLHWYMAGGQWAFNQNLELKCDLVDIPPLLQALPIAYIIEQRKYPPVGLVSAAPLKLFSEEGFIQASLVQLLDCLIGHDISTKKRRYYNELDFVILGGEPARKSWAKGNIIGINLGAALMPQQGTLTLFKRKKLRKTIDQQLPYKAF